VSQEAGGRRLEEERGDILEICRARCRARFVKCRTMAPRGTIKIELIRVQHKWAWKCQARNTQAPFVLLAFVYIIIFIAICQRFECDGGVISSKGCVAQGHKGHTCTDDFEWLSTQQLN